MVSGKKVSIILPVYNGSQYLKNSIDSILRQTYTNFELIVVDDCSTDSTPDILREYASRDNRVKVIRNTTNQKLPNSLNIGFSKADGDYFTWTSDDNCYLDTAFETMVNFLNKHFSYGMVYTDMFLIDAEGNILRKSRQPDPVHFLYRCAAGACFLYRRKIAKAAGEYDSQLFLAEDYDYWLRIYQISQIKHLRQYLYCYRSHGKSLTSTKYSKIKIQTGKVLDKHFPYIMAHIPNRRILYAFLDQYALCKGEQEKELLLRFKKQYRGYGLHRVIYNSTQLVQRIYAHMNRKRHK